MMQEFQLSEKEDKQVYFLSRSARILWKMNRTGSTIKAVLIILSRVGMYGEGVYAVANHLYRTGHKPVTKLYSGYRHEIHNYKAIKNEVVAGITDFFDSQLG